MVQQVNGAFHFLLYKSLVLTLTFFKMVLKHSVETHTFEEGVFGVGTFGAYPHTFEEGVFGFVRFGVSLAPEKNRCWRKISVKSRKVGVDNLSASESLILQNM